MRAIARHQSLDPRPTAGVDDAEALYFEVIRRLFAMTDRGKHRNVTLHGAAAVAFQAWRRENQLLGEAMGSLATPLESHLAKHPACCPPY
jgi:hypothetical protein